MKTVGFQKQKSQWYLIYPKWPGSQEELRMSTSVEEFLNFMAGDEKLFFIDVDPSLENSLTKLDSYGYYLDSQTKQVLYFNPILLNYLNSEECPVQINYAEHFRGDHYYGDFKTCEYD